MTMFDRTRMCPRIDGVVHQALYESNGTGRTCCHIRYRLHEKAQAKRHEEWPVAQLTYEKLTCLYCLVWPP